MRHRAHEYDIVELLHPLGGWPVGTLGAVVAEYPHSALIEIADEDESRDMLDDLVSAPYDQLQVVDSPVSPVSHPASR